MDDWYVKALTGICALFLLAAGVLAFREYRSPTISLKKSEWECVTSKQEVEMITVITGETTSLQPMFSTVCIEYRRRD